MKIKIASRVYDVLLVERSICDVAEVRGWCDYEEKKIFIDCTLAPRMIRDTLWHEIFHCLMHEHGFPDKQDEEPLVTFLGRALEAFCHDNKKFVRAWLLE